jgi:hypothetical protein
MARTWLTALALVGLLGCGSKKPPATHSTAGAPAARPAASGTTTKSKTQRKTASRPDTATTRNPLTNH